MPLNRGGPSGGDRIATGVPGLDRILCGGLRRGAVHMVVGEPGAGKTVLAHQIASRRVHEGGTVLYLTLMVESQETLVTQARGFTFFDPSQIGRRMYYASALGAVRRSGAQGLWQEIVRLVEDRAPVLLVLDGAHTMRMLDVAVADYFQFFSDLGVQASLTGMTALVLFAQVVPESGLSELAVPDGVLRLGTEESELRVMRRFAVEKMRSATPVLGWHAMTIDSDGIRIYPRIEAMLTGEPPSPQPPAPHVMRFGVDGLDSMLGGGVPSASVTLAAGEPGAGKTLLGLAFLATGAEDGEPGLYFGFHETPDRLIAKAENVGIRLRRHVEQGVVRLVRRSAVETLPDEIAQTILDAVVEGGARRVVLDSLDALRLAFMHPGREIPFLAALSDMLRAQGIGAVYAQEIRHTWPGGIELPIEGLAGIVDNAIVVRYLESRSRLRRILTIMKMREQEYDTATHEFRITGRGIEIGGVFDPSVEAFRARDRPGPAESA